jgi:hypothetical protein
MSSAITGVLLFSAALKPALGFCGSRTHLDSKRAEAATFGYFGEEVSHSPRTILPAVFSCSICRDL